MKIIKLIKLYLKGASLDLSRELMYKGNFFIKSLALVLTDFIGPFFTLLIYSATAGIPGWTLYEFLLFQGTLIIIFGLGHLFVIALPYDTIRTINKGEFDKYLTKPFSPLLYLMSQSILVEGIVEFLAGTVIVGFAIYNIGINIININFLAYIFLIIIGLLFQIAAMILISSLAFLVVKSEALMMLFFNLQDFARYPLNIYPIYLKIFLVFLFPAAISAFFPAQILLQGLNLNIVLQAVIPVLVIFTISIFLWNLAMKKYSSAGG